MPITITITIGGTYRFDYKARPNTAAQPDGGAMAEHTGRPVTVIERVCETDHGTLYECSTADGATVAAYGDELSEV